MRSSQLIAYGTAIGLLVVACGTSGSGSGELVGPATPNATVTTTGAPMSDEARSGEQNKGRVGFDWKSDGASWERGTIRAMLPDGRVFEGQYLEPSSVSEVAVSDWMGWNCGFYDCFGAPGPSEATVRRYSGYLLARLDDGGQTRMNCRFQLDDPQSGPAHGGMGVCTLSDGERITGAQLGK